MKSLNPLDVSPLINANGDSAAYQQVGQELLQHCTEIGFVVVRGHGVADEIITRMREAVARLFSLPRSLLAEQTVEQGNYRGYVPLGFFSPNSGVGSADHYEAWKLHTETPAEHAICARSSLYGENRWPAGCEPIKEAVFAYWQEMERVNTLLLCALCRELSLDTSLVLDSLRNPLSNMTLLNYPATESAESWGIHPHKDFNLLTLLAHDPVGGLELRDRSGEWLSAECSTDALVVNVGDMLELWSGGRLRSTPHRVVNRSAKARQSFPYFSVPRFDVVIEPLLAPVAGFTREPLHCGRASADIWTSNWPDRAAQEPGQELGNYND